MKTGRVVLIAIIALIAGGFLGTVVGGATGAAGGGLAGVCYTSRIAVEEGMLSAQQSESLLTAIATKHAARVSSIDVKGDLNAACKELLARGG